ncbi:SGNH/GDSL hydrolase family protein [Actinoplanes sp. NPDC051346]|uniref:SGNH/GDSL hydrolase family protein n=1 Tax=Actinoplanes sp. NPDC051346 TaxID=3155048 RepID=UPI003435AECC
MLLLTLVGGCEPGGTAPVRPTVVTLGDSVPAGTGCACSAFPELYARHENALSLNLAETGLTSAQVRAQLGDPTVRDALRRADEVLLMVGANDVADDFTDSTAVAAAAADVHANVRETIDGIQEIHQTTVVVLGYWNVVRDGKAGLDEYGESGVEASVETTRAINDALEAAASESGAAYVSTDPAFHGPDGGKDATSLLIDDGDHPDSAGHTAIARLIPPVGKPFTAFPG